MIFSISLAFFDICSSTLKSNKSMFSINGQKYKIDLSEYQEKTIQYKQEMAAGENKITVTVTNFDGAESTFEGICTYNP